MRVLIVHSEYRSTVPSGENSAVWTQAAAIAGSGHDVRVAKRSSDEGLGTRRYDLRSAAIVASGLGPSPLAEIEAFNPDVVHIHNLFPNYGRRWVKRVQVPIVHTLHNFRPLCAAATLFRDGQICTLCPDGRRGAGVRHACYGNSRARTLPIAVANARGAAHDPVIARADALIVLSDRSRAVYEDAGVDGAKLIAIPNFVPDGLATGRASTGGTSWLYAGRLSREKGIDRLIERWPPNVRLRVAGSGPLASELVNAAKEKTIEFVGHRSAADVVDLMRSSVGLVFPSRWYEGFPMVYAESLSAGLPVLAWAGSSVADLVDADQTGTVVTWKHDVGAALSKAEAEFPRQRERCREVFAMKYTQSRVIARLVELYGAVIRNSRSRYGAKS